MSDRRAADEPRPGTSKDDSGSSGFLNSNTVGGNVTTGDISTGNTTTTNTTVTNVTNLHSASTLKEKKPGFVTLVKGAWELKRALKKMYEQITLPNVSWMDQGVLTFGTYFVQLELTELEQSIRLEQIFEKDYGSESFLSKIVKLFGLSKDRPKRILIEAPPGYGKTTLAYKLVNDWATAQDYLNGFEFAFLITLRHFQQSVPKEIADIAECSGFDKKDIVKDIVDKYIGKTLIILDGFDELKEDDKKHIVEVLFKKRYQSATVVVTSRMGSFQLTPELRQSLGKGVATMSEFNDEKIDIRGLNDDNRRILLEKLTPSKNVIDRVEEIIKSEKELFECPLFVILLAFIVEEQSDVVIETKTDLFEGLVDCVARRSCSKLGEELPDDFTLFDDSESYSKYRDVFYRFGKLSDRFKNSLHFECNDETNEIYKMGFLIKHEEKSKFSSRCHYEGFHLSILEFANAYSLWIDYKNNGHEFTPESIDYIVKLQKKYGSSCLIIPFVCGLLGEEATNFFVKATSNAIDFSMSSQNIWSILAECKFKDRLTADTISPFSPPYVDINSISIDSPMLDNLHCCKKVVCDYDASLPFEKLSKNISIHYLHLSIDKTEHLPHDIQNFVNIKCNKLKFLFDTKLGIEKSWFDVFKRISAKSKNLVFCKILTSETTDCVIKENILEDTPINKLAFRVYQNDVDKNILRHFISRNRLKKLEITLPFFFEQFPSEELIVSTLTHLQLISYSDVFPPLDLSALTNNGRKKWKQLSLIGFNIVCTSPITDSKCVSTFKNINCTNFPDVFGSVIPDVLHCDCEYIINAYRSPLFRKGFDSVKELRLELNGSKTHSELESCFSFLGRNQSLTTRLFIDLTSESSRCKPTDSNECNIIEWLKWCGFHEIFLKYPDIKLFSWSNQESLSFPDIIVREKFKIDTLIVMDCEISQSRVDSLLRCLKSDCVKIVIFAFSGEEKLPRLLTDVEIDREKYNIRHDLFKKWPLYENLLFRRNKMTRRECLSITSKQFYVVRRVRISLDEIRNETEHQHTTRGRPCRSWHSIKITCLAPGATSASGINHGKLRTAGLGMAPGESVWGLRHASRIPKEWTKENLICDITTKLKLKCSFDFFKADVKRNLHPLNFETMSELADKLGRSCLYVVPCKDFFRVPALSGAEVPATTVGVVRPSPSTVRSIVFETTVANKPVAVVRPTTTICSDLILVDT